MPSIEPLGASQLTQMDASAWPTTSAGCGANAAASLST